MLFRESKKTCVILGLYGFLWISREDCTVWKVSKYAVFSRLYFPTFGLNTERYEVSIRIQSQCGKIRSRKNSVFGHFSCSVWGNEYILWERNLFFYMKLVSLMCQSVLYQSDLPSIFILGKIAILDAGCVFLYFCNVHKNNACGYNFVASFTKVNLCNF